MVIELPYEELDGYIRQICVAQQLVFVECNTGDEVPLLFRYPDPEDTYIADLIHRRALKEAQDEGLPSLEEMEGVVKERGIFTEVDEKKIEKLRSRIEGQRSVLAKTTRVPARRDRLKDIISGMQKEIEEILTRKELSMELTSERKAIEERFLYLTRRGTFDPRTKKPYWENETAFANERDFLFRKRVFLEYIVFSHGLSQSKIRFISRSNLWRIRYVTALKTGESLFGRPISKYTVDQLTLLYWSHYYQSIYEMMSDDRPSDNIIEDDQALDAYMSDWHAERNRDAVASKAKSNNKYGQNSAWDHGETLVMKSNPMHADVEYSDTIAERGTTPKGASFDAAPTNKSKNKSK